jgi:hypothetical protein
MFTSGGPEVEELRRAITTHSQYGLRVVEDRATVVVFKREELLLQPADFYQMLFNGVRLVSLENLYEEIFERVPLSLLSERWFLDNISSQPKPVYDFFKRVMDIVLAVIIGLISLPFYPLVYLLVKLTDGGPVFFWDTRVGKGGRIFRVPKFRSMSNEADLALRRVTALGAWLRKTRICTAAFWSYTDVPSHGNTTPTTYPTQAITNTTVSTVPKRNVPCCSDSEA